MLLPSQEVGPSGFIDIRVMIVKAQKIKNYYLIKNFTVTI